MNCKVAEIGLIDNQLNNRGVVEELQNMVNQLRAENDRLKHQLTVEGIAELESAHMMMFHRNKRLQKENDDLAVALRFYTNKNDDGGIKARAVLQKYGLELDNEGDKEFTRAIVFRGQGVIRERKEDVISKKKLLDWLNNKRLEFIEGQFTGHLEANEQVVQAVMQGEFDVKDEGDE